MRFKEHDEVERPAWLGEAWDDSSWHNDAMPHCTLHLLPDLMRQKQPVVEIWVNYPRPEDREIGTAFEAVYQSDWGAESGEDVTLYSGEAEATAVIWERAARTAKSMILAIAARPDLNGCKFFVELHDHCDANMLGDVEEMTKEGEAHRTKDDDPEVSITSWALAVHTCAVRIVDLYLKGR